MDPDGTVRLLSTISWPGTPMFDDRGPGETSLVGPLQSDGEHRRRTDERRTC
jgi:hypothetical protein